MSTSIETLVALGSTDQQLLQTQRELRRVEAQIADARKDVDYYEKEVNKKQQTHEEVETRHRDSRQRLEMEDLLVKKLEAQVPLIRTQKEFVASKKQLEETRKRRGLIEDEILEFEIQLEEATTELTHLKEHLSQSSEEFEGNIKSLLSEQKSLNKKLSKLKTRHKHVVADLDAKMAKFYDRCRTGGIVPAVCPMTNKSCSGCHMQLLPQLVNELLSDPSTYKNCPFCGRIVYYVPEEPGDE